jgi:hypothetical protein
MKGIRFKNLGTQRNEEVKNKIIRYFFLFLKKEKMIMPCIHFFKGSLPSIPYSVHKLFIQVFNKIYIIPDEREKLIKNALQPSSEIILEASQRWRIYLLDNFQNVFGDADEELQENISHDIIWGLRANFPRLKDEALKAIQNFNRKKTNENI